MVDVRLATKNLLRLAFRIGERLFKLTVAGSLPTVNFAIQDLLCVDLCVLVPFRATAFAGDRDGFSMLSSGFLFDDIYRLGTAFEVRDVLRGFRAKLCFRFLNGL